jgi:hypothetical protein
VTTCTRQQAKNERETAHPDLYTSKNGTHLMRFIAVRVTTSPPPSNNNGMRFANRYTVMPSFAFRPPMETPASTMKGWPSHTAADSQCVATSSGRTSCRGDQGRNAQSLHGHWGVGSITAPRFRTDLHNAQAEIVFTSGRQAVAARSRELRHTKQGDNLVDLRMKIRRDPFAPGKSQP